MMKRILPAAFAAVVVLSGCGKDRRAKENPIVLEPTVKVVSPARRTLQRTIAQPGVIEAYEQTAMFPRVNGVVKKWHSDAGDRVKKGDLLVEIDAPEMLEEHNQKLAIVEQEKAMVEQCKKQILVAERNSQAEANQVQEAKAGLNKSQADVERWEGEVARLTSLVKDRVIDTQVLEEAKKQMKASTASREVAKSVINTQESQRLSAEASIEKAKIDVTVAQAKLRVAEAEERRTAALIGYLKITAPYDAMITARHVNTGDTVRPSVGDADGRSGSTSRANPLYMLVRTDRIQFVLAVPELDSAYVGRGTPAQVRVQSLGNEEFPAEVSRTSWALNRASRTLQAEIDLPNNDSRLVPGMYAYGSVIIERENVRAIPAPSVFEAGNQTYCYLLADGRAVRTPVQTGISDTAWVEIKRKKVKDSTGVWKWADIVGDEAVIVGELSEITDGMAVKLAPAK